ncbi:MAG: hypothetical protein LBT96_02070 [Campylobacteraceae bacterium]|jgi:hypothetical protein|nr:hypothetical protein [Campylobacteraceae bacterium]
MAKIHYQYLHRDTLPYDTPEIGANYGIKHIDEAGNPIGDFVLLKHTPRESPIIRDTWMDQGVSPFGMVDPPMISEFLGKETQSFHVLLNYFILFRRFINGSRSEREKILIEKVGFFDSGTAIDTGNSIDTLFLFTFAAEPSQYELYMADNYNGSVTEINHFHNGKQREVSIPLDSNGLLYVFLMVGDNINGKFRRELTVKENQIIAKVLDASKKLPAIDNISLNNLRPIDFTDYNQDKDNYIINFLKDSYVK